MYNIPGFNFQAQDSKNKARTAGNVLNSLLEGKHPRFVGQTAKQVRLFMMSTRESVFM